jgi:hypothetical protein
MRLNKKINIKLLIIFHTTNTRRTVLIFFLFNSNTTNIYLNSQVYDDFLKDYLQDEEKYNHLKFMEDEVKDRLCDYNFLIRLEKFLI